MRPQAPDNERSQSSATNTGPTLLMATRGGRPEEAEPVLVARTSTEAIFVLDDGEEIRFDQAELRNALDA